MPAHHENVSLYFGSTTFGAPDHLLEPILQTLWNSRTSIALATQQLTDRDVVQALVAARRRGVAVRVFLERDYLREPHPTFDIWREEGDHEAHRKVLSALYRSNVDVRVDTVSRLMHNNFVVADVGQESAVAISTSANLTTTGLRRNLEHLLMIREQAAITAFHDKFQQLWSPSREPNQTTPSTQSPSAKRLRVLFEPENDIETELINEFSKAARSLTFSLDAFSTKSKIEPALIKLRERGIRVFGVLDGRVAKPIWTSADNLDRGGVTLFLSEEIFLNKLHHKLAIVDDRIICIGTFNFSFSAAHDNQEAMIILDLGEEGREMVQYAQTEIARIVDKFCVSSARLLGG